MSSVASFVPARMLSPRMCLGIIGVQVLCDFIYESDQSVNFAAIYCILYCDMMKNPNINAWFFRGGRLPEREYAEKQQWFLGMFILWLFFETKAPCEESHRIETYQSPVLMSILFQNLSILSCSRNAYSS